MTFRPLKTQGGFRELQKPIIPKADPVKVEKNLSETRIIQAIKNSAKPSPIVNETVVKESPQISFEIDYDKLGKTISDSIKNNLRVSVNGGGGGNSFAIIDAIEKTHPIVSIRNSTSTPLAAAAVFTGAWEDVSAYQSVTIAVKTTENGTFSVQFSPDGTNQDSTLTRYYRTNQIETPHRLTVTRKYCRVVFTNTSASDQTALRLQTIFGEQQDLNATMDSTLSQDFDAVVVRPTDYNTEVALGRRQGATLWNKFGYNASLTTANTAEVISSWGGTFVPMTTARTLSVVSTDATDANGNTGANNIVIYGIDANRQTQTVVVTMNGTTPVVTTETWLGVNRIAIGLSGTNKINAGTITATATTDLTIQAEVPIGEGTSQQCIFFTQDSHQALIEWLTINPVRFGAGTEPVVTVKAWVYSAVSNSKYEVARLNIDTSIEGHSELTPPLPFPIGEKSCFWLEASSTRDATAISARFSLIEVRDVDA